MNRLICALACWILAAGCGDSSGPDAGIPDELVGRWRADAACAPPCAFTLTWTANPQARLDAIATLGIALDMDIGADGRFVFAFSPGTVPPAGKVRVSGQRLVVTDADGAVDTIAYRFEGSALRLDFQRQFVVLDFDANGQPDPSTAAAVFLRR